MQPNFYWEKYIDPTEELVNKRLDKGTKKLVIADSSRFSRLFEGWILHSPIDISGFYIQKLIKTLPSVEIFVSLTRYRCIICFAKSFFDPNEVPDLDLPEGHHIKHLQKSVEQAISEFKESPEQTLKMPDEILPELKKLIDVNKTTLNNLGKEWVMLVLPNGSIVSSTGETKEDEDLLTKLELFYEIVSNVGGLILTSWADLTGSLTQPKDS